MEPIMPSQYSSVVPSRIVSNNNLFNSNEAKPSSNDSQYRYKIGFTPSQISLKEELKSEKSSQIQFDPHFNILMGSIEQTKRSSLFDIPLESDKRKKSPEEGESMARKMMSMELLDRARPTTAKHTSGLTKDKITLAMSKAYNANSKPRSKTR